jgi:hypothetical protein
MPARTPGPSSDQHCHAHLNIGGRMSSRWTSDVRRPAAAGARPARIARRYGRHESLHLIAHRNPGLPAGRDGCGQTVHSGLREHEAASCMHRMLLAPGPVYHGRRVTQTEQSADEHRVRTQRMPHWGIWSARIPSYCQAIGRPTSTTRSRSDRSEPAQFRRPDARHRKRRQHSPDHRSDTATEQAPSDYNIDERPDQPRQHGPRR